MRLAANAGTTTPLSLPSDEPVSWAATARVLRDGRTALATVGLTALDAVITRFAKADREPRVCTFFAKYSNGDAGGNFDFDRFLRVGAPLLLQIALDMPALFVDTPAVPMFRMRSACGPAEEKEGCSSPRLRKHCVALTRRQCACLLAHSFLGSLKRPDGVQPNDWRFTVVDLFLGTAVSPNSATTFLNYFNSLGEAPPNDDDDDDDDDVITIERLGFDKGRPPWDWEASTKPLCKATVLDGAIEDSVADTHADFANAFVGGGCMTGDAAQEEMLFLVKPELMLAMATQQRMVDEEAIRISGARQYAITSGFGQDFEFHGDYDGRRSTTGEAVPPTVCAIDAVRGGGPAMTSRAMLRDMNKARLGFEGAAHIASGHWGCGAYGNNHDLMFLKQWLAASEAGAKRLDIHDFSRNQSHHIVPLIRKLRHLTVGQLWTFLLDLTHDIVPCKMGEFYKRVCAISVGKWAVPGGGGGGGGGGGSGGGGGTSVRIELQTKAVVQRDTSAAAEAAMDAGESKAEGTTKATKALEHAAAGVGTDSRCIHLLEALQSKPFPDGVVASERELYLREDVFQELFKMDRETWLQLPTWKRSNAKKKLQLF
jgi:uncharacterized membrane protein YgcG